MSKVALYRRQVSEDPDIDNLLSTLSAEEMEELEKELDASDTDGSLPVGLGQKDQTVKQTSGKYNREKEPRKCIQKEQAVDEGKKKEGKILDEKHKDIHGKNVRRNKSFDLEKECKKEENVQKANQKAKDEPDIPKKTGQIKEEKSSKKEKEVSKEKTKTEDRTTTAKVRGEEKNAAPKYKLTEDKGKEAVNFKKGTEKDSKKEEKKEAERTGDERATLKQRSKTGSEEKSPRDNKTASEARSSKEKEEKLPRDNKTASEARSSKEKEEKLPRDNKTASEARSSKEKEEKLPRDSKITSEVKSAKEEQETAKDVTPDSSSSKPADTSSNQDKEEEATSIFDEPLEKVKNNDPELTEINVNNSDCINNEILVRFAEALEFNTVVKVFALANTRADDHVAFAISIMLKSNKALISINLDSNHITGKGILAIFRALLQNNTLTELRFHNQRHICGGKTEMEIAKLLKENTTLLKLGYHFELAGPRMTVTNLLSRNMDKQRQKRLQEQKQVQEKGEKKHLLEVPKAGGLPAGSPKASPKPSPKTSPWSSPKPSPKKAGAPDAPPPPPPPLAPPLAPPLINENLRNSLSPATQRKMVEKALPPQEKNSRDQLLAAIRSSNLKKLKKVEVPKLLQ